MVLRYLLSQWLGTFARDTVRESVVKAAREAAANAASDADCDGEDLESPPCHVGVVFASGAEAGGFQDRLTNIVTVRSAAVAVHRGTLGTQRVAVVQSGTGAEAVAGATLALIAAHQPNWVIAAGFATGLIDAVNKHDLLMVDSVIDEDGRRLSLELKIDPDALATAPGVHAGGLLTASAPVREPEARRVLGRTHEAMAVDGETFAVAEVCRSRKTRLLGVRIIRATVQDELPAELERLGRQKTTAGKLGAVVGSVMNRPGSVKDMLQIKEDDLVASDRLAVFLESIVGQLATPQPENEDSAN